ncbi:MAG: hypothetical protein JNJ90_18210 [Saprospiraceae bacterium]|nr:hypothetical protein [Saprospiraceae bacterium]
MGTHQSLQAELGDVELQLTKTFAFFDTYADILSQRLMPGLGRLLAGCDALALDAMRRHHPALDLVEPPLVYCDRGYGASIARQDVRLPDGTPNPMPMIQIPYTRILEKWNLTSVLHEAGHEVMVRLGMVDMWPRIAQAALARQGASAEVQHLFGMWMSEIGPDFWTFGCSGIAAPGGIRELLVLPPAMMLRISETDPHPTPYLRVLINFEWCRQVWGFGLWDQWEQEWLALYPLEDLPEKQRRTLLACRQHLPTLCRAMLQTRLQVLSGKPMTSLFDLNTLHPVHLRRLALDARKGRLNLSGLRPTAHLAVFRLVKELNILSPERLDAVMAQWLKQLKFLTIQ